MSNKNIINSMLEVLTKFEKGYLSSTEVEESMEFHIQALEKIGSREVHNIRDLSYQLVTSHMMEDEDEYSDPKRIEDVMRQFRSFIQSLPID